MPPINKYKCNSCSLSFPSGWGGHFYAEDAKGQRVVCPHPAEKKTALRIIGHTVQLAEYLNILLFNVMNRKEKDIPPSLEVYKARTGYNSHCVCLDCLQQFELDLGDDEQSRDSWRYYYGAVRRKDKRLCPCCASTNVKTVIELIGSHCPKCGSGVIKKHDTGIMT